jgi:hypothetical protein
MSIGTATMSDDKMIILQLRAEGEDEMLGDARFEYRPDDPMYDEIMKHVPGLEPGISKPVPPWPELKNND